MALPQIVSQPVKRATILVNPRAAALAAQARFGNLAAYLPAYGKTVRLRSDQPGVQGDFYFTGVRATGYGIAPIPGSPLRFLDCDSPAIVAAALAAVPRLAETYRQDRGDHAAFAFLAGELPNLSRDDDHGHELVSLRGPGLYQIGAGSLHPSGDVYTCNGKPPITLTADECAAIRSLFPVRTTPRRDVNGAALTSTGDDYDRASANLDRISPDCSYADWIALGQGLKAGLDEAGYALWDTWSARSAGKYPGPDATRRKWDSFRKGGRDLRAVTAIANEHDPAGKRKPPVAAPPARTAGLGENQAIPNLPVEEPTAELPQVTGEFPQSIDGRTIDADGVIHDTDEGAPTDDCLTFYTHPGTSLGALVRLLNSHDSVRALDLLPIAERSRATVYRRSRTFRPSIDPGGTESATPVSPGEIRERRIRLLFPQADPVSALIPQGYLSAELFAGALSEDDVAALVQRLELTTNERTAIRIRLRTLIKIERLEKELDDVPFVEPNEAIANLPDLRRHVLRQICRHYETNERPAQLANVVQACLLGVTKGALAGIRQRAGVEQDGGQPVEKTYVRGETLPANARNVRHFSNGTTAATVQPTARQRVVALPVSIPRPSEKKVQRAEAEASSPGDPGQPKPARPARRPSRELYAARLMSNILQRFKVQASADLPLDELASKLRAVIALVPTGDDLVDLLTQDGATAIEETMT